MAKSKEEQEIYRQGYVDGFWACAHILGRDYHETEIGRMAEAMIKELLYQHRAPAAVRKWAGREEEGEEAHT